MHTRRNEHPQTSLALRAVASREVAEAKGQAMTAFVKVDTTGADRLFEALINDQLPFATALALTSTAKKAVTDTQAAMRSTFGHVSRYTLNSLFVKGATKSSPVATIAVKTGGRSNAEDWLGPEVFSGPRLGGIEAFLRPLGLPPSGMFAVPLGAMQTSSGQANISKLKQIVSQLVALPPTGVKGLSRKSPRKAMYFYLERSQFGLKPGIYGVRGHAVVPLIAFVGRPSYKARFDFFAVVEKSVRQNFPGEFRKALDRALATRR